MRWGLKSLFLLYFLFISVPTFAQNTPSNKLSFSPEPKGLNARLARVALEEHFVEAEDALQRAIPFATARFDLNNDGIPELFVKMLEEKFFCDTTGCDTFVLKVVNEGPQKIASFRGTDVEISSQSGKSAADLKVSIAGTNDFFVYSWDNGSYVLSKGKK